MSVLVLEVLEKVVNAKYTVSSYKLYCGSGKEKYNNKDKRKNKAGLWIYDYIERAQAVYVCACGPLPYTID